MSKPTPQKTVGPEEILHDLTMAFTLMESAMNDRKDQINRFSWESHEWKIEQAKDRVQNALWYFQGDDE